MTGNELKRQRIFRKIIKRIRKDAHKGLELFHKVYGKLIEAAACTCRDKNKVDEVVQNTMIKVWRAVTQSETTSKKLDEIKNPEGWVYKITVNCVNDVMKSSSTVAINENITAGKDHIQNLMNNFYFDDLISSLNAKEQEILSLHYVSKETFQEICDWLEIPTSTVSSTFYRAIEKLKNTVDEEKI